MFESVKFSHENRMMLNVWIYIVTPKSVFKYFTYVQIWGSLIVYVLIIYCSLYFDSVFPSESDICTYSWNNKLLLFWDEEESTSSQIRESS